MRIAVDGILFRENKVVLIKRGGRTFHGYWALPGGILEEGETVEQTLQREMLEEVGVEVTPIEILGVYSDKERDPREHTISVVFICEYQGSLHAGDDAKEFQEFTLEKALELQLAFDHKKIILNFITWLGNKTTFWSSKQH